MKLANLSSNYKLDQIFKSIAITDLNESILDYFSQEMAKIKNKENPFEEGGVDIDKLSKLIAALKILGDKDTRSVLTKDDIGINIKSISELYDTLSNYNTSGSDASRAESVINALSGLSKSLTKEIKDKFEAAKTDKAEKTKVVAEIDKLYTKVKQIMAELKSKLDTPNLTTNAIKFA